jgi:hypothetical protein
LYLYDFGQYPEIFSAKALLDSQLRNAYDQLESEVTIRDRALAGDLFYSGTFAFEETDVLPLAEFALFQRFTRDREQMFRFTKSHAVLLLEEKLNQYPEAVQQREPKL